MKVSHIAASEANSPEPSAPPKPISDLEIKPRFADLPYSDENPSMVGPFDTKFPHHKQAQETLLAQNGSIVIQHWWKSNKIVMKEGDLAVAS